MRFHRLFLAVIVSLSALAVTAPVAHMQPSRDPAAAKSHMTEDLAMPGAGGAVLFGNGTVNTFPFSSNCFSSATFCNSSFFGGCFNFCRSSITGCFNNFGCHSVSSSFFPFFNSFNSFPFFNRFGFDFNFNNGTTVNCIQIMRMPGGGTITIRVC